jgi:nicotinamidase-related amidase
MQNPKLEILSNENCALLLIDFQPEMGFSVTSIDRQILKNNVIALAKSAKLFNVPTFITSVESETFSGYVWPELLDVFPDHDVYERTSMDSFDDEQLTSAIKLAGRKKLILAGLWTEVCINLCALSALQAGYQIYVVEDACGGTTKIAQTAAMQRMMQVGVVPLTWQQLALEWQRDWARTETYEGICNIIREYSGAYGMGIDYAATMVHKQKARTKWHGRVLKIAVGE